MQLDQVAQIHVQWSLEPLQRQTVHNVFGQSGPVFFHPQIQDKYVQLSLSIYNLCWTAKVFVN